MKLAKRLASFGLAVAVGLLGLQGVSAKSEVEVYPIEHYYSTLESASYIPLIKGSNFVMDGDGGEWGAFPAIYPTKTRRYGESVNEKVIDLMFKIAYDDERCYLYAEVTDKDQNFIVGANYWQGDSIQLAFGGLEERFGIEYGISYDVEKKKPYFAQEHIADLMDIAIDIKGSVVKYEMSIPWTEHFENGMPDMFKFCILANNDDGMGREYCVMLATGIEERKVNESFPTILPLKAGLESFAWVEGALAVDVCTNNDYAVCIANLGGAFTTDISVASAGINQNVSVPAKSFVRIPFNFNSGEIRDVEFELNSSAPMLTFDRKVSVEATFDFYKDRYEELGERIKTLEALVERCAAQGIPTDYERVNLDTMKLFTGYIIEDFDNKDAGRMEYTFNCLDDLYEEAYESLNAYLSGTRLAKPVPRYVTSDVSVKGSNFYAQTEFEGRLEERPVFFNGHGHDHEAYNSQHLFQGLGQNYRQGEMGPNYFVVPASAVPYWQGSSSNNVRYDEASGNHYMLLSRDDNSPIINQYIIVKPKKEYKMTFDVKGNNVGYAWLSLNSWEKRITLPGGTYDWTTIEHSFTGEVYSAQDMRFFMESGAELMIDNIKITEVDSEDGEEEPIVLNGDFEQLEHDSKFEANFANAYVIFYYLYFAEINNVAVSFLVATHYIPDWIYQYYPEIQRSTFYGMDFTNEIVKEFYTYTFKTITKVLKNYKSVSDICIQNEGRYTLHSDARFLPYFREELSKMYDGDIARLNENYRTEYASFDEVEMTPGYTQTPQSYDLTLITNKTAVEFHAMCADVVKSVWPEVIVHGKLQSPQVFVGGGAGYSYHTDGIDPYAEGEALGIHGLDGGMIYYGGTFELNTFTGSGFLFVNMTYDYLTSNLKAPILNTEDHMTLDGSVEVNPYVAQHVARYTFQSAVHGRAASAVWIWNRTMTMLHARGHLNYRPDAMAAYGKASLDSNRLSYELEALQDAERKVGLLFSEASRNYSDAHVTLLPRVYSAIAFNGQKTMFMPDQNPKQILDCELLYVPCAPQVKKETLLVLKEFLDKGGKLVIFDEESLKYNEYNLPHDESLLNDILPRAVVIPVTLDEKTAFVTSFTNDELHNLVGADIRELGLDKVVLIDVETGETVKNIEWLTVEYNGKLLINIANYNDYSEFKQFKVLVNGKQVPESRDLISGKKFRGIVEIKPAAPLLLEVDAVL